MQSPEGFLRQWETTCRSCKRRVLYRELVNGGSGLFEVGEGLSGIKHACATIGAHLPRERDADTPDLFA